MTKAQILDQIIEKKSQELKQLTKTYVEVEKKRDAQYFEIIQEYFGGEFTLDDVYFNHDYGTTFVVKRPHKEYNYDKEMIPSDLEMIGKLESLPILKPVCTLLMITLSGSLKDWLLPVR